MSSLFSDLDVNVQLDVPLGPMTWYGVGGHADILIRPLTVDALSTLVKRCRRTGTPLHILGSGANLLVSDAGVDGVVITLDSPAFKEIRFEPHRDATLLRAMAGADMAKTLNETVRRGFGGLVQMAGIPASIGGAIRMNAGGAFGSIGDTVHSVTCISRKGDVVTYPATELTFGYRRSNIPDPIIISASFLLHDDDPVELRHRVKEIFAYKKSTQPLAEHSAGCAFKNPVDPVSEDRVSAGMLIDRAGLKGFRIGSAVVSDQHANFLTVDPGGQADDLIRLMEIVQAKVYAHAGIELEREVAVWRRGEMDC